MEIVKIEAKDIITELKHYNNPKGKYTLEYHRAEYYIMPNSDEDSNNNSNNVESQDPEFVQNHAYVIAYNNKKIINIGFAIINI